MRHTETGRKLSELVVETFRLNGAIINAGDALVKDLGLTSARWQVLSVLLYGPATVSDIARSMGLSRQNVQRIANRLGKDGFIAMADNPAHRRAKLCSLSKHGKETMDQVAQRQIHWANGMSDGMDPETMSIALSQMKECLRKITSSLKALEKETS